MGAYILIATINRCIKPKSKARLSSWYEKTYLSEIMPKGNTYLNSDAYANHFDYLTEANIEAIELAINKRLQTEFNVKMDQLFYDPTNALT